MSKEAIDFEGLSELNDNDLAFIAGSLKTVDEFMGDIETISKSIEDLYTKEDLNKLVLSIIGLKVNITVSVPSDNGKECVMFEKTIGKEYFTEVAKLRLAKEQ